MDGLRLSLLLAESYGLMSDQFSLSKHLFPSVYKLENTIHHKTRNLLFHIDLVGLIQYIRPSIQRIRRENIEFSYSKPIRNLYGIIPKFAVKNELYLWDSQNSLFQEYWNSAKMHNN